MRGKLFEVLSHATIILSVVFLTFFVIDRVNPAMEFIGSDISDWFLGAFCVIALWNGITAASFLYNRRDAHHRRTDREVRSNGEHK